MIFYETCYIYNQNPDNLSSILSYNIVGACKSKSVKKYYKLYNLIYLFLREMLYNLLVHNYFSFFITFVDKLHFKFEI